MTKLTTEITIEELQYRINAHENDLTQMWTADYFLNVQKELLALKQATKNPVAYRNKFTGQFFTLEQQPDAVTDTAVYEPVFLAAPVLPKQPELVDLSQQVEILNRILNWILKELPVPTKKASAMAIRLSSVIDIISDLEVSAPAQEPK